MASFGDVAGYGRLVPVSVSVSSLLLDIFWP